MAFRISAKASPWWRRRLAYALALVGNIPVVARTMPSQAIGGISKSLRCTPRNQGAPGLLFPQLRTLAQPRLVAWAVAVDSLASIAQLAEAAKVENTDELTKEND
jgi:hypothetical protein